MTYRVRIDPVAQRHIDQFARYLRDYNEDFAIEQIRRLDRILFTNLAETPRTWSYFPLTGLPEHRTAPICSGSAAEPNIGSSIRSTKRAAPSMSFRSGTQRAIRTLSSCKHLRVAIGDQFWQDLPR